MVKYKTAWIGVSYHRMFGSACLRYELFIFLAHLLCCVSDVVGLSGDVSEYGLFLKYAFGEFWSWRISVNRKSSSR